MHDLSLVLHLLDLVEKEARHQDFQRVIALDVEIGELAAVDVEAFRHGYQVASLGTAAEGAELRLACTPGRARCQACGLEFALPAPGHPCPDCGGERLQVLAGRELRLRALEVC